MGETGSRLGVVSKSLHLLRGAASSSLGEVGDALGAIEKARRTTRHKLAKCGRHPKKKRHRSGAAGAKLMPRRQCRAANGEVGAADGEGGVAWGQEVGREGRGVAQRRGHGPLTNLSTLAGPGSTPTKFSTVSLQSKRDRKKT